MTPSETLWLARRVRSPPFRGRKHDERGNWKCFFPLVSGSRSSKTFKPKKNIPEGSHQYELLKHAEATLGSGNLRQAVMLPEGEDLNEWIAVNSESWERENQEKLVFYL